jgi:protein involved in polysaccharide export with SLBB domain
MLLFSCSLLVVAGCDSNGAFKTGKNRFFAPNHVVDAPEDVELNVIRVSLTEMDPSTTLYGNARRPKPMDWVYSDTDYRIGARDYLEISVLDLYSTGLETVLRREVTASGYIKMPLIDQPIKAEGLDATELTAAIEAAYSEDVLKDPVVSVTIQNRRQQTFSMLGGVLRPGTYNITRADMRLLDAMALTGGLSQSQIKWIYVIRQSPAIRASEVGGNVPASETTEVPKEETPEEEKVEGEIETKAAPKVTPKVTPKATPKVDGSARLSPEASPLKELLAAETEAAVAASATTAAEPQFVFRDGKWVEVKPGETVEKTPSKTPGKTPTTAKAPTGKGGVSTSSTGVKKDPFDRAKIDQSDRVEVIAIDRKKLMEGDLRMNIVVKENDVIRVPPLEVAEFYMYGEVSRPGVYSLTGREITVKMAMAAVGNLTPLSWPENSVIIRRIGAQQEQIIPINIELILQGKVPDFYLKKNDVIQVGTHWSASFMAVFRNAFRMTYGFGFIYDRNYADPMLTTPDSKRFSP